MVAKRDETGNESRTTVRMSTKGSKRSLSSGSYIAEARHTWRRRSPGKLRVIQSIKQDQRKTAKKTPKKANGVEQLGQNMKISINYAEYSPSQSEIWMPSVCLGEHKGSQRTWATE